MGEIDIIDTKLSGLIENFTDFKEQNHEGHLGIMKRQDHTNGTVCEHEEKLINIKSEHAETLAYLKGMLKVLTIAAIVTPAIVGSLFALFLSNVRHDITNEINTAIEENNELQFETFNKKQ